MDFCANLDPNSVIFYSVDLPSSSLSKYIKIISHLISSSDLIEFQRIPQKYLNFHGFDPYSPLYFEISDLIFNLVTFELFYTSLCIQRLQEIVSSDATSHAHIKTKK